MKVLPLLLLCCCACLADEPPAGLERWLTGNPADVRVDPQGPALILMGGGRDVDAAFTWWKPKLQGGDVVVLRVSGSDGYNRYLHDEIGGCDSVETLKVTSRALADDPWVAARVAQAEGIWIAGGNQWNYVELWRGTQLQKALQAALKRGAVVGGTSAGCALLGGVVFSAEHGTVRSRAALADPFTQRVALAPAFVPFAALEGVVTDTHFSQRKRLGRLLAFVSRTPGSVGLGVDERTAVAVDAKGRAVVLGSGGVTLARQRAGRAQKGTPLTAEFEVLRLEAGDRFELPNGKGSQRTARRVRVEAGKLLEED